MSSSSRTTTPLSRGRPFFLPRTWVRGVKAAASWAPVVLLLVLLLTPPPINRLRRLQLRHVGVLVRRGVAIVHAVGQWMAELPVSWVWVVAAALESSDGERCFSVRELPWTFERKVPQWPMRLRISAPDF